MNVVERREKILKMLMESEEPIKGVDLAEATGVSRQIVVQDIALLRVENTRIMATNKGYIIYK